MASKGRAVRIGPLLRYWQKELNLLDWRISAKRGKAERGTDGVWAVCDLDREERTAEIRIDRAVPEGRVEDTLVHELLHVVLYFVETKANSPLETMEEQAINSLAGALVRLKRKAEKANMAAQLSGASPTATALLTAPCLRGEDKKIERGTEKKDGLRTPDRTQT